MSKITNDVIDTWTQPVSNDGSWYVSAALRLLRKCIGLKDEFYYRHITRLDLFRPVVEVFAANAHKYNLLNSALIELFDFIRVVSSSSLSSSLIIIIIVSCYFASSSLSLVYSTTPSELL